MTAMKAAIATLDLQLTVDARFPDLDDLLAGSTSSWEYLLPTASAGVLLDTRYIPLPDDVLAHEHQLVMQLPNVITNVALFKPKPGTKSAAMSFHQSPTNLHLSSDMFLADVQLGIPTDGTSISCIKGTSRGRIFMGGNDGHLYEFIYEEKTLFGRRKCARRNHTRSRLTYIAPAFIVDFLRKEPILDLAVDENTCTLFVLTLNNNITTFYLGEDGSDLVPGISLINIHQLCHQICPRQELVDPYLFHLKSIHLISPAESQRIQLLGISNTGCRVYFSLRTSSAGPLERIYIAHIRMPPTSMTTLEKSHLIHANNPSYTRSSLDRDAMHLSFYMDGLWAAVNAINEGQDTIVSVALDVGEVLKSNRTTTMSKTFRGEVCSTTVVPGKIYDLVELDSETCTLAIPSSAITLKATESDITEQGLYMNELATQIAKHRRHFLVLSNNGVRVFAKRRPIDELIRILRQSNVHDAVELHRFFEQYGRDQFCAMALALGCNNPHAYSLGTDLHPFLSTGASSANVTVSARARRVYFEFGGKPVLKGDNFSSARATDLAQPLAPAEIIYSGMHNGLALYLARVVRPFWRKRIIRPSVSMADRRHQLNVPEDELNRAQRNLKSLHQLIQLHAQYFAAHLDGGDFTYRDRTEHLAIAAEQKSVHALSALLIQTIEALAFIRMLFRLHLPELVMRFPLSLQQEILGMTYEQFIASSRGKEISRDLVMLLINDPAVPSSLNIDSISEVLERECPLFCSAEDIQTYKAMEMLQKAKEAGVGTPARLEHLNTSLSIASKISSALHFDKLQQISSKYNELEFFLGTLRLALDYARKVDPTDAAMAYFKEDGATSDSRQRLFDARQRCYGLIFDTFALLNKKVEQVMSLSSDTPNAERYSNLRESLHAEALSSRDELFHHFLYEWYLQQGRHKQLLQVESPYLEEYLQMNAHQSLQRSELLANYYITKRNFLEAARVQHRIARGEEYPIDLEQRLTYLSLAIANANSSPEGVQLLHELESKQEMARVQMEVLSAIKQSYPDEVDVIQALESTFIALTELYKIADRFILHDCKLSIIACAEGQQPPLTLSRAWRDILEHDLASEDGQQITVMSSHLTQLCIRFADAPHVLTSAVLVPLLEEISLACYDQGFAAFSQNWWIEALLAGGVEHGVIYFELDRLWTQRRAPFNAGEARLFLLDDICCLLETWVEYAEKHKKLATFPYRDIARYVSRYIETLSMHDSETSNMRDRFRGIESQLRRVTVM